MSEPKPESELGKILAKIEKPWEEKQEALRASYVDTCLKYVLQGKDGKLQEIRIFAETVKGIIASLKK